MRTRAQLLVVLGACGTDPPAPDGAPVDTGPPPDGGRPTRLSETGLYAPGTRDIARGNEPFAPTHVLWSDGADKRRWVFLPAGAAIDARDADRWQVPVGTKLWKEFSAPDGTRIETRLVERIAATGDRDRDFWLGAFVWRADGSDADFAEDGATDVNGTHFDVPAAKRCPTCHGGEPGMVLGLSALQLSGPGTGVRLDDLVATDRVQPPIASRLAPGDATTAAALGYLHANCGHCHNAAGAAWPDVNLDLRLSYGVDDPHAAAAYRTAVGVPVTRFTGAGLALRIAPGDAEASAVAYRMRIRGTREQMPPIATELVDPTPLIVTWIDALPAP